MNITVWADFVCPFCYIGSTNLAAALDEAGIDDAKIEYKSFQLSPSTQYVEGSDYWEALAKEKGIDVEQLMPSRDALLQMAGESGLDFRIDDAKNANTTDAHRLFQLAKQNGKGDAFFLRLYRAIFTESVNISDHAELKRLADEVGLDADSVAEVLTNEDKFSTETRNEIMQAHQVGVQGVPFFVFNDKYAVSGAQPKEGFVEALKQIAAEG